MRLVGVLCLVLLVAQGSNSPSPSPSPTPCFPLTLSNECGDIFYLANVTTPIPPDLQRPTFDNFLALAISNVRMSHPSCRRPLLWAICLEGLGGGCGESGSGCQPGDEMFLEELCEKVEENCGNAPSFCADERNTNADCEDTVRSYLFNDIPVETCLGQEDDEDDYSPTDCCYPPFEISPTTGECIVPCPYYGGMTEGEYEALSTVIFSFTWVTIVCFVLSMVPLLFMTGSLDYPKYYLPLALFGMVGYVVTYTFGYYFGLGYYCFDEEDNFAALDLFYPSARCLTQGFFLTLFAFLTAYFHMILSFVVLASVFPHSTNLRFLRQRPPTSSGKERTNVFEIIVNVLGVGISLGLAAGALGAGWEGGENGFAMGFVNVCDISSEGRLLNFWNVFFSFVGVTLIVFCVMIGKIILMDWRMLLLQLRSLLVLFLFLVAMVFGLVNIYFWNDVNDPYWFFCVATSPPSSTDWKSCPNDTNVFYIAFSLAFLHFYPFAVCIVSYLSTPFCREWWRALVTGGELGREMPSTVHT